MAPTPSDEEQTIKCCGVPRRQRSPQCFTIDIPPNDPVFKDCMEFVRSDAAVDMNGEKISPREQINDLTSFLDASSIYGTDEKTMLKLRTQNGKGALLKTNTVNGKARLPKDPHGECVKTNHPLSYCQMAGDNRVNEQPALSSIHLIFHLQHNIIVRSLVNGILQKRSRSESKPTTRQVDNFLVNASTRMKETLFQETRKIMGGILQKITYCDWLPMVVGPVMIRKYNLTCRKLSTYDPHVDPRIANAFLTAAFRFGHSLIPNQILVDYERKGLQDMFEVPDASIFHHESIVFGLCEGNMSRPFDRFISNAVSSNLFRTAKKSLDLISLNVQRGRDHGIPSYYYWREYFGLSTFSSPEQIASKRVSKSLNELFPHLKDIDLFTAGLMESPVRRGIVGDTFGNILAKQFSDLKFGDAYFFLGMETPEGFTRAQRKALLRVSIAQFMCYNSGLGLIQKNPFIEMSVKNPMVPCENIPKLDLKPWIDQL